MKKLLFLVIALVGFSTSVMAHSWYDAWCCNNDDCAPIPSERVEATDDGWLITLYPGDHPLVTKKQTYIAPYFGSDKSGNTYTTVTRQSRDHKFHACLYPSEEILRCFYEPPMGF